MQSEIIGQLYRRHRRPGGGRCPATGPSCVIPAWEGRNIFVQWRAGASMNAIRTAGVQLTEVKRIDDAFALDIDRLAANATEPNPFYESWCLRPALEFLSTETLQLLAVRNATNELIGLLPLTFRPHFKRLPQRTLRSWIHECAFLAAPLLHRGHLQEAVDAILDWFASKGAAAGVIELVDIRADGDVAAALDTAIARRPQLLSRRTRWTRAMHRLDVPDDPEHMSAKQRSTLRRKERRLGEEGALSYRTLSEGDDLATWLANFLQVEASGWKGRAGTALGADESRQAFLFAACQAAHARGQLHMLALELDGRPIAMKCNFVSGSQAFTFKIAYEEAHARHSPGVLIELFQMRSIRETHPQLEAVDSCTVADNTMFPNLWPGQCVLGDYAILHNTLVNRLMLNQGERVHRMLKRRLVGSP
ncbi:GNAT family N-acetyltransferase [Luteimonas sp. MJ204]|uniref:GNAT family N-acetyltransferase n=1 Tax=Luteimonas sp. MJ145 TaxID=3129234 RepID=UPI0031BA7BAB